MTQELIYTSAPRGLAAGSTGFCTVAATAGSSKQVRIRLEALSGYEFAFNLSDARATENPVNLLHTKVSVGGRQLDALSRVAFCGADHSRRTNKIAHHLLVPGDECVEAGPAWSLQELDRGTFIARWEEEPRELPPRDLRTVLDGGAPPGPSSAWAWERITGDAGWGGALVRAYQERPQVPAFVVFPAGLSLLPLFAESLALLPPAERWDLCFATYFTSLPPGTPCHWRGVLAGSSAARKLDRFPNATVLDLTRSLPPAGEDRWAQAARRGERLVSARAPRARRADKRRTREHEEEEEGTLSLLDPAQLELRREPGRGRRPWEYDALARELLRGPRPRQPARSFGSVLGAVALVALIAGVTFVIARSRAKAPLTTSAPPSPSPTPDAAPPTATPTPAGSSAVARTPDPSPDPAPSPADRELVASAATPPPPPPPPPTPTPRPSPTLAPLQVELVRRSDGLRGTPRTWRSEAGDERRFVLPAEGEVFLLQPPEALYEDHLRLLEAEAPPYDLEFNRAEPGAPRDWQTLGRVGLAMGPEGLLLSFVPAGGLEAPAQAALEHLVLEVSGRETLFRCAFRQPAPSETLAIGFPLPESTRLHRRLRYPFDLPRPNALLGREHGIRLEGACLREGALWLGRDHESRHGLHDITLRVRRQRQRLELELEAKRALAPLKSSLAAWTPAGVEAYHRTREGVAARERELTAAEEAKNALSEQLGEDLPPQRREELEEELREQQGVVSSLEQALAKTKGRLAELAPQLAGAQASLAALDELAARVEAWGALRVLDPWGLPLVRFQVEVRGREALAGVLVPPPPPPRGDLDPAAEAGTPQEAPEPDADRPRRGDGGEGPSVGKREQ